MKKIILILSILIGLLPKAQQNELLNNTWYLQKVVIDDVEYIIPEGLIDEEGNAILTFSQNSNPVGYSTNVCSHVLDGNLSSISNDGISLFHESETLGQCSTSYQSFENKYFSVLHNTIPETVSYSYIITPISNYLQLSLTNSESNQAFYTSQNLSTIDKELEKKIMIYPNPSKHRIKIIISKEFDSKFNLKIINSKGQLVFTKNDLENEAEINISNFQSGAYFCVITNTKNEVLLTKKWVKE